MPLGERGLYERGGKRGAPLLKRLYSTAIVHLLLQIGTDMLLIITSTGDELLRNVKNNDLE